MQVPPFPELLKDSEAQRRTMVDCQVRTFDVTDQRLIGRLLQVPRELFVPDEVRAMAYSDIGFVLPAATSEEEPRYLLPPLVLARMIQGARLKGGERVLDIAPGGGYSTAVLVGLVQEVHALETDPVRRGDLERRLKAFDIDVPTFEGDLSKGVASNDLFDVILVNGAVQTNLEALFELLADGGRILAIARGAKEPAGGMGRATSFEKHGGSMSERYLFDASAPTLRAFKDAPQFVF